jgi:acetolactate synthase regulatory subunit
VSAAVAMRFAPRRIERVLLIVNPASRRGLRIRAKAIRAFADAAVACDVMETKAPGHAAVLATAHAHK